MRNVDGNYDDIIEWIDKYKPFRSVQHIGSEASGHGQLSGISGRANWFFFSINEDHWPRIDNNKAMSVKFGSPTGFHEARLVRIEDAHLTHKLVF